MRQRPRNTRVASIADEWTTLSSDTCSITEPKILTFRYRCACGAIWQKRYVTEASDIFICPTCDKAQKPVRSKANLAKILRAMRESRPQDTEPPSLFDPQPDGGETHIQ